MNHRLRKVILYLAIAFLTPLILAEVILRVQGVFLTYSEVNSQGFHSPYKSHSDGLFIWEPNTTLDNSNVEYSYSFTTNQFGLRGEQISLKKDSRSRVILLGDSFVEGAGTPIDSTWANLMNDILISRGDSSHQFLSGGCGGSDPFFYTRLYNESLSVLDPDVVIAAVNHSDFEEYIIRGGNDRFTDEGIKYRDPPINIALYRYIHLYRFYCHIIEKRDGYFTSPSLREDYLNKAAEDLTRLFIDFNEELANKGKQLIVVIYPVPGDFIYFHHTKERMYVTQMHDLLKNLLKAEIQTMDLTDCLYSNWFNTDDRLYWPKDMHFNSKGYLMLAGCTVDQLPKSDPPNSVSETP